MDAESNRKISKVHHRLALSVKRRFLVSRLFFLIRPVTVKLPPANNMKGILV